MFSSQVQRDNRAHESRRGHGGHKTVRFSKKCLKVFFQLQIPNLKVTRVVEQMDQ